MPWWGVQAGGGEGWVRRAGCRCERGAQDIWHGTQRQARAGTCQKWPYKLAWGAHAGVAGQRQLAAAAQCHASHRRNGGLGSWSKGHAQRHAMRGRAGPADSASTTGPCDSPASQMGAINACERHASRTPALLCKQHAPTRLHQVAKSVVDAVIDAAAAAGLHKLVDVKAGAEAACRNEQSTR